MKWFDRLKAKIIHALGGLTRAEAMFPAPIHDGMGLRGDQRAPADV